MTVKEAAQKAAEYLKEFYPTADKIQLEEIEKTDDDAFWLVTLSYLEPSDWGSLGMGQKAYKLIKLTTDHGEFRAIKIRTY